MPSVGDGARHERSGDGDRDDGQTGRRASCSRPSADDDRPLGRVLIVDDDASLRLVCAVTLKADGLRVLEAAHGLDGLEQARCERPELVITDVKMPGLDGFQLAGKLRGDQCTSRIPLIFLSGEGGHANARRAPALGAFAYLTKPVDPGALADGVARELAAAQPGRSELTTAVAS